MSDKVIVKVKSESRDDELKDCIEVDYIGKINEVNGNIYIRYEEMFEGESRMTENLVKIYPKDARVEITKKGPVTAHMEFKAGEKRHTFYETPFGAVDMGIYTREADIIFEDDEIKIFLDYSIESNCRIVSECCVSMEIRKCN
ncbi:MAG: DUF1934 domain-containing protein [Bacteroides sp.]